MIRRLLSTLVLALALAGCEAVVVEAPKPAPTAVRIAAGLPSPEQAVDNVVTVVERIGPVAERVCRERRPLGPCNFDIVLLNDPELPPNAFQTADRRGRPVIAFTIGLVAMVRNPDELAFILGHEAAHHIAGHLERTRTDALEGALIGGVLASVGGAGSEAVREAQRVGASMGARRYSKTYELEADVLGTRIAWLAGFDPVRGAQYFARIPDPGDRLLGTHPPNAERIRVVRQTAAQLRP